MTLLTNTHTLIKIHAVDPDPRTVLYRLKRNIYPVTSSLPKYFMHQRLVLYLKVSILDPEIKRFEKCQEKKGDITNLFFTGSAK